MPSPIDISEENGVRYLHFGSEWVQGAMRVRRTWDLELQYTREMMAGLLLRPRPWPRSALVVGLGAGSVVKFIHRNLPGTRVTVVEIDPRVVAAARQFFRLPREDERLSIEIADAVDYVAESGPRFDWILVDGYDHRARAGALAGEPFLAACRARLRPGGMLCTNLFGQRRGFRGQMATLTRAFGGHALAFPPVESGNVAAHATDGPLRVGRRALRLRAGRLAADTGLDLNPTLDRLEAAGLLADGALCL